LGSRLRPAGSPHKSRGGRRDLGGSEKHLIEVLGLHAFVAKKISVQAQQFDLPTLENIFQHLLIIDLGEKTGGMPGEIALDVLIARLASTML